MELRWSLFWYAACFAATFSGSAKKLIDLKVPETYLWAEAFADLQTFVNTESRRICSSGRVTVLKELEAVDSGVKKLYPIVQDGVDPVEAEVLQDSTSDLGKIIRKTFARTGSACKGGGQVLPNCSNWT
ncbi:UNVERIFIED_CONTAM: protein BPS1, chloroplastic [Sesamum calycinum]|uniref:Protein BPS1, chloroplastic n=1 Tax=Sesamum calycinum TaxID=2727403 RepID=A0AAW2T0H2_9LAMI